MLWCHVDQTVQRRWHPKLLRPAFNHPDGAADHHDLANLQHLVGFFSEPDGLIIDVVDIDGLTVVTGPIALFLNNVATDHIGRFIPDRD